MEVAPGLGQCYAHVCTPTCAAALGDNSTQTLADCESQVRPLIDSHAEGTGNALEGHHQIHSPCAETREHGPDLQVEQSMGHSSFRKQRATHTIC